MKQKEISRKAWLNRAIKATNGDFRTERSRAIVLFAFLNAVAQDQNTMVLMNTPVA